MIELLLTCFLTPWLGHLFLTSPLILLLSFFEILALIFLIRQKNWYLVIIINILLIILTLPSGYDEKIFQKSNLEIDTLQRRFDYYGSETGRLVTNRIGIFYIYKISPILFHLSDNFYSNIDPN